MSESKDTVLVTGGAGFIGSHLAERLAREGRYVRILDDLSTGRIETIRALTGAYPGKIEFVQGDVRDAATVGTVMKGVADVLHQAALPSVERSIHDPWTSHDVNVNGTLRVLEEGRRRGIRRFVLAGSSSVYGDQPELPKRESMVPSPRSPYAMSKLIAESYARLYAELYGMSTLTLRYFNVFGPRQDPASPYAAVIPLFFQALVRGEAPVIFGDGQQTRDFTYIDNVVDANLAALACDRASGQAVNVACGERTSLLTLLKVIGDVTGKRIEPVFEKPRVGDVRDSLADVRLAAELLGIRPGVALVEGIRRTSVDYVKTA